MCDDTPSIFHKIEGAALNLRGILLEMIVAHLLKQDGYDIEIRQKVTDSAEPPNAWMMAQILIRKLQVLDKL
jgi:hypothetical protein